MLKFIILLLFCNLSYAQVSYKSRLLDSDLQPISQGVIKCSIANDTTTIVDITISSYDGSFNLSLLQGIDYQLQIKHLSYKDTTLRFKPLFLPKQIILKERNNQLQEIIIKHIQPKIEVKTDTTSFDLTQYIDSNDRKLKDLLEKIPGLVINSDGSLYFNGQIISRLLVEGETFFGGGTKLGIDNIPADALEKLEIISNYSKSKILKNDRRTNEQVINLILKNKNKTIIFGDTELAGDFSEFYKLYASFFNFKVKNQNNLIVDNNNLGITSTSYNDYAAMSNVDAELFKLPQQNLNLFKSDQEYSELKDQSYKLQLRRKAKKSDWDFLFSYNTNYSFRNESSALTFINSEGFDNIETQTSSQLNDYYIRTTNYLQTIDKERVFALAFNYSSNNISNDKSSTSSIASRNFNSYKANDQFFLNGLVEQTHKINDKLNLSYGIQSAIERKSSVGFLGSNLDFLESLILWQSADDYIIDKNSVEDHFNTKIGAKLFYSLGDYSKLIIDSNNRLLSINGDSQQSQRLDAGLVLLEDQFQSRYSNQTYITDNGLTFRHKKRNFDLSLGLSFFAYSNHFKRGVESQISNALILPKTEITYTPNSKNEFQFKYRQRVRLPSTGQLDESFDIQGYSSIIQGNLNLSNTKNHILNLRYSNINLLKSYSFSSNNSFEIEDRAINTSVELDQINQISQFFLQSNPASYFNTINNFTYIAGKIELGNSIKFRWSERIVLINDLSRTSTVRVYQYSPYIRSTFKKHPNFNVSTTWSKNELQLQDEATSFQARAISCTIDHHLWKYFYLKYLINYVTIDGRETLNNQNFEIRFTNQLKTIDISLLGINFLESGTNTRILQDSFTSTEIVNTLMPRRILLSFKYFF